MPISHLLDRSFTQDGRKGYSERITSNQIYFTAPPRLLENENSEISSSADEHPLPDLELTMSAFCDRLDRGRDPWAVTPRVMCLSRSTKFRILRPFSSLFADVGTDDAPSPDLTYIVKATIS